jgi:hypothetical protein
LDTAGWTSGALRKVSTSSARNNATPTWRRVGACKAGCRLASVHHPCEPHKAFDISSRSAVGLVTHAPCMSVALTTARKPSPSIEYGADNLVSGTTIIDTDTAGFEHKPPSQDHLAIISRTASSANLKLLCLKIEKCCPIWCPPSSGSIAPKHDSDAAFAHLQRLAKSTVVHVLFDYNWIHIEKQKMLQDLLDEQKRKKFSTLPFLESFKLQHRKADWTVFSPVGPLAAAPTPYSENWNKRPRSRKCYLSLTDSPSSH